jgi:hypothetical protein
MPVALFAVVLATIISDVGITLGFWVIRDTLFPLNQLLPHYFSLMPVLTMWVFKFTYSRFLVYMVTNLILDIGFSFFFLNIFLPSRGIIDFLKPPLQTLTINLIHAVLIYGFQMWQEGAFVRSEKVTDTAHLQPAAAKPLDQGQDEEKK